MIKNILTLLVLLMGSVAVYAQHRITGTVTSADGKKIEGAVIQVKATTITVATDANGTYLIEAPTTNGAIIVSAKDAISVELPINARTTIDIQLGKELSPVAIAEPPKPVFGKWTFGFSGNINTRFNYILVDKSNAPPTINGSWLSTKGTGDDKITSIANGFAPCIVAFNANTQFEDGTKLSVVVSSWYGIATSKAITDLAPIDVRQIFALISNKKWGAVKFGRDNGMWAQDQRLNDITIVGGNGFLLTPRSPGLANPGGCGAGYTYNDRIAQISYYTPNLRGFEIGVGIFNPLDFGTLGAGSVSITSTGAIETNSTQPGVHGRIKYNKHIGTNWDITLVSSGVSQKNKNALADFNSWSVDGFAKIKYKNVTLSGYYYDGEGTGIGGYLSDAADVKGLARDDDGGYAQLTYEFGKTKKWLGGLYYGYSRLGKTANDPLTLIKQNTRSTAIVKYKLYESLMFSGEYTLMESENHEGGKLVNRAFSVGAYLTIN